MMDLYWVAFNYNVNITKTVCLPLSKLLLNICSLVLRKPIWWLYIVLKYCLFALESYEIINRKTHYESKLSLLQNKLLLVSNRYLKFTL